MKILRALVLGIAAAAALSGCGMTPYAESRAPLPAEESRRGADIF